MKFPFGSSTLPKPTSKDMRKNHLDGTLQKLSKVKLASAKNYEVHQIDATNFVEWFELANNTKPVDKMRAVLYWGFQPLYDALTDAKLRPKERSAGIQALDKITSISTNYLTSYYAGEPDIEQCRKNLKELIQDIDTLRTVPYTKKFRNIDYNGIVPAHIVQFLSNYLTCTIDGKAPLPEYLIGCACGSSEITLPLAGLLQIDADFIRRSYRRGDTNPRIIEEHLERIKTRSKGRNVTCIEDYVCSGRSLKKVMEQAELFDAATVKGVSVNLRRRDPFYLNVDLDTKKMRVYGI